MANGKQPMQADGAGTKPRPVDDIGELASRRGEDNAGESGGGAYPSPRTGRDSRQFGTFSGHGGQSEQAYHGAGQLSDDDVGDGQQANAASKDA